MSTPFCGKMGFVRFADIIPKNPVAFETAGEIMVIKFHNHNMSNLLFSILVVPFRPASLYRETRLHINLAEVEVFCEILPFLPFNYKENIKMCGSRGRY